MPPKVTAAALHAALLRSDSATAVLEAICGAPITVRRHAPASMPAQPTRLAPAGLVHRQVSLVCGRLTLSDADLWFRPDLLPAAMVSALAETDAPFGRVVGALGLRRQMLAYRLCGGDEAFALEHRALLADAAGRDVAEVWERYGWDLVAAP